MVKKIRKKYTRKKPRAQFQPTSVPEASTSNLKASQPAETMPPETPITSDQKPADSTSQPQAATNPPSTSDVQDKNEKPEETINEKSSTPEVPSIDPNAPLKIEELTSRSEVPTIDKNAPLKIEEVSISDELSIKEKTNKKLFLIGIAVFTAIIVGTGIFATFWLNTNPSRELSETKEVSPGPEVAPTKPAFDKGSITFEVLNGSGLAGAAKKYADNLQTLGYNVVKIGNADNSEYQNTQLYVASNLLDKIDPVLTDLKISSVSGTLTDSTASARIIVGKE